MKSISVSTRRHFVRCSAIFHRRRKKTIQYIITNLANALTLLLEKLSIANVRYVCRWLKYISCLFQFCFQYIWFSRVFFFFIHWHFSRSTVWHLVYFISVVSFIFRIFFFFLLLQNTTEANKRLEVVRSTKSAMLELQFNVQCVDFDFILTSTTTTTTTSTTNTNNKEKQKKI